MRSGNREIYDARVESGNGTKILPFSPDEVHSACNEQVSGIEGNIHNKNTEHRVTDVFPGQDNNASLNRSHVVCWNKIKDVTSQLKNEKQNEVQLREALFKIFNFLECR